MTANPWRYDALLLLLFALGGCRSVRSSPVAAVDHIIIGVSDLGEGMAAFERATGVSPMPGGQHPSGGTENALISLGHNSYLEIIAPRSDAQASDSFASYLRTLKAPALVGWAVRVQDVAAARVRIQHPGLVLSQPAPGSRITPAGQKLEWVTFGIEQPKIDTAPFFIQWSATTEHPSASSPPGCIVRSIRLEDPESEILSSLLRALNIEVPVQESERSHMLLTLQCAGREVSFASP
jgi:hypothetical protein